MAVRALSAGRPFVACRLESDPNYASLLDPRDWSLARNLVATVKTRCGQINAVLSECCDGDYSPKNRRGGGSAAAACLRVGAAQLLFLDVPPHTAVKETVDTIKLPYGGGERLPYPW